MRARTAGHRRAGPAPSRLGRAQSRGAGSRRPVALRRAISQRSVRSRPRPVVSRAGGGGRGPVVRPRRRRRRFGRSPPHEPRRHDQSDVPGPQARARGNHRHAAAGKTGQERRRRSLQFPDGPHLSRHRHGPRRRSSRHGAPAGRGFSRPRARRLHRPWPRHRAAAVAPCASARSKRRIAAARPSCCPCPTADKARTCRI